jgi:hypothetical protein
MAKQDMADLSAFNTGAFESGLCGRGSQIDRWGGCKAAAECTDSGTGTAENDDIVGHVFLPDCFWATKHASLEMSASDAGRDVTEGHEKTGRETAGLLKLLAAKISSRCL